MLFGGAIPPNGFWIQVLPEVHPIRPIIVWVNDNGPINEDPRKSLPGAFELSVDTSGNTLVTPAGYKPMGPVSIFITGCQGGYPVTARAWLG
jgi:hypothetical protein